MASPPPVLVVDTSTLVNLASPRVDPAVDVPAGNDPLKNVLVGYDVHVPDTVPGELAEMATQDDFLGTVAGLVLDAGGHLTEHATDDDRTLTADLDAALLPGVADDPASDRLTTLLESDYGLDRGELDAIALARELPADLFATDEVGAGTLPTVVVLLDGRSPVVSTPQLVGLLAAAGALDRRFAAELLEYLRERKGFSRGYVELLSDRYLGE